METQGMNRKWRVFAEKVAAGTNLTEAYLQAGYQPATREAAQSAASRLRRRPEIRRYIRHLRTLADSAARQDTVFTIQAKLALLARIAQTGAGSVEPGDEIVQYARTYKDGGTATRLPCKLKAINMHSELAGHFDPPPPEPVADLPRRAYVEPPPPIPFSDLPFVVRPAPAKSETPQQTITENPDELSHDEIVLQRVRQREEERAARRAEQRAAWTPTPQPFPYPGDLPGIFPARRGVTVIR